MTWNMSNVIRCRFAFCLLAKTADVCKGAAMLIHEVLRYDEEENRQHLRRRFSGLPGVGVVMSTVQITVCFGLDVWLLGRV